MKRIGLFIVAITTFISLMSCGASNNYLTQKATVKYEPKVNLVKVKAKIEKPIIEPESFDLLLDQAGLLDRLEAVDFVSSVDVAVSSIINEANSYIGTPYRFGGTTRRGIDCSAFMQKIYDAAGVNLPRVSSNQAKIGIPISKSDLQKGDLIFFSTTSRNRITHVGMVVGVEGGNVKFIHAASSRGVSIASLSNAYWKKRYRFARRPKKFIENDIIEGSKLLVVNK